MGSIWDRELGGLVGLQQRAWCLVFATSTRWRLGEHCLRTGTCLPAWCGGALLNVVRVRLCERAAPNGAATFPRRWGRCRCDLRVSETCMHACMHIPVRFPFPRTVFVAYSPRAIKGGGNRSKTTCSVLRQTDNDLPPTGGHVIRASPAVSTVRKWYILILSIP